MGRGGKVGLKRGRKRRVRSKDNGSDDSDEDYMVEEDEVSDYEESSFEGDELEENSDSFEEEWEEEEEEEEEEVRKVARSKVKMGSLGRRKVRIKTAPKRKRASYEEEEEEDEDYHDDEDEEEEEEEEVRRVARSEVRRVARSKVKMGSLDQRKIRGKTSRKRKRASFEEEEDDDDDVDYDDDDEEFTPEEVDGVDDEEEFLVKKKKKKNKVCQQALRKRGSIKTRKRMRKVMNKPLGNKGKNNFRLRRKAKSDDDGDFVEKNPVVRKKSTKKPGRRKNSLVVRSDSDFVSSGSSDFDFTISEEEREQVREASKLCGSFTTSLRSSSSSKRIQEDGDLCQQRKPPGRKGKEKVEDVKNEVGNQVCGICLSEEGKRIVQGTLNCCNHYFCFSCIMEWSKVESRCPLCKQRFVTISKPARLNTGIDLRNVVINVPERDQVYQPSEEEIRGFLDPYENVICTECHQGGDDNLMLLCDLCDSPAHTYCVNLGREVPEGNWYCEGCRPVALGSSNSRAQDLLPDQRTMSNNLSHRPSPFENIGEDLNHPSVSLPSTLFTQGIGVLSSPRYHVGDVEAASPTSGAGVSTLSRRRQIRHQIHNRMRQMAGRTDGISAANLGSGDHFHSQIDQSRATTFQHTRTPETGTSYHNFFEERIQDNPSPVQNGDLFPGRLSHFRRQVVQDQSPATADGYVHGTFLAGINSISGYEPLRECSSRSSIGSDGSVSPCMMGDGSHFYIEKEQVQSMVRSHLKSLSRDFELGFSDEEKRGGERMSGGDGERACPVSGSRTRWFATSTFKDVARKSTHTILAACGLEHRRSEVYSMQPPPICSHVETMADGQMSLLKGYCSSCFDSIVRNVVKTILNSRLPHWLRCRD
ncbi:hypothetical protein L1049_020946 [Liquidambar formosana]|uniref:Uncharacterized protein n=1 Tax=Liquidambar formosana TaxID=63359 RepID=A0AAP0SC55_LIQFO